MFVLERVSLMVSLVIIMACALTKGITWDDSMVRSECILGAPGDARESKLAELEPRESVYGLAFSPDGRFLLSGGNEGARQGGLMISRWDLVDKKLAEAHKSGNLEQIRNIAFSPDGAHYAVGDRTGEVHVWTTKGKHVNRFRMFSGHESPIKHMSFRNNEELFAVCFDSIAEKWNIHTNRTEVYRLDSIVGSVFSASATGDLKYIAWTNGYKLRIDRDGLGEGVAVFAVPDESRIVSCAISADGRFAMVARKNGQLCLWDVPSKKLVKDWAGHGKDVIVTALMDIPRFEVFATGDDAGKIKFWSHDGAELGHIQAYRLSGISVLAVSQSGLILASAGENERIVLWDLDRLLGRRGKVP